jgi:hypothetical protein
MAVNTDWRKYVTDTRVEWLKRAVSEIDGVEGEFSVLYSPLVPLCNPAVAIELRLQEVLVCLVEEKGIDVNSYRWNNYDFSEGSYHLLYTCMHCENIEAFRYLLGRKDIDIHSKSIANNDDARTIVESALYMDCCADFARELLAHPSFDIVASFTHNGYANSPLHFAINIFEEDDPVPLPIWKANFRLLLSAGACPYMEAGGMDAIEYVNKLLRDTGYRGKLWKDLDSKLQSKVSGLRDAVEILEDWVAIK